jgi:hypothetical protein
MNDPPVWNHQYKPKKICYWENNESNFKAISLSPFFSLSLFLSSRSRRRRKMKEGQKQ